MLEPEHAYTQRLAFSLDLLHRRAEQLGHIHRLRKEENGHRKLPALLQTDDITATVAILWKSHDGDVRYQAEKTLSCRIKMVREEKQRHSVTVQDTMQNDEVMTKTEMLWRQWQAL